VEALDLAVGAGPVGLTGPVLDAARGEQLAQRAVFGVGPRVVGEDPPDRDPMALVEAQGLDDEVDDGGGRSSSRICAKARRLWSSTQAWA
jgi:hypothetical protein